MKYPKQKNFTNSVRQLMTFTLLALICLAGMPSKAEAQGTAGAVTLTTIPSGSVVIPMDNTRQGNTNCAGPVFNLKAYGLVVRLLHNNIPVRWAIANKNSANRDSADFTVSANRYTAGTATQACTAADGPAVNPPAKAFAGGPFIIMQPDVAAALPVINAFNAEITATTPFNSCGTDNVCSTAETNANRVRVYITNAAVTDVPIRYTLNHKPFIAVGPDAAQDGVQVLNFRFRVHERLYDYAKVASNNCTSVNTNTDLSNEEWGRCNNVGYNPYYRAVPNDLVSSTSCFTIATQAHAEDDVVGNRVRYRQFATSGGNLLFQCRSIDIFERGVANPLPPPPTLFGLFQTSSGWGFLGTEGGTVTANANYPNPWQPFKQFVGNLNPTYGNVGEYGTGTTGASFSASVIDSPNNVASVGNIADFSDPDPAVGGHIFELGGHDYFRVGEGTTNNGVPAPNQAGMTIENLNGQRMILNAILVPAQRTGCALAIPEVAGFKQVQLTVDNPSTTIIGPNDVATWTIRYINNGPVPVNDFQIVDALDGSQTSGTIAGTYVPGTLTVTPSGAGTLAPINSGYNGVGNKDVLDPAAAAGARVLGANGGMITVTLQTVLTQYNAVYLNHPVATGSNIEPTPTDTVEFENNNTQTFGGHNVTSCPGPVDTTSGPVPAAIVGRCYDQNDWQTPNGLDPTGIRTSFAPSAAPVYVEGRVIGSNGRGLARTTITLRNESSGEQMAMTTNSFGYFRFDDLTVGDLYVMSPFNKQHAFPSGDMTFTLDDNLSGVTFVGVPVARGESAPETKVSAPETKVNVTKVTLVRKSKTKTPAAKQR